MSGMIENYELMGNMSLKNVLFICLNYRAMPIHGP